MTSHPFDQNLDQAIESTTFGDISIVGFQTGSLLDESLVRTLESTALNAAVTVDRPKLIVDFEGVVHLTSAALGALLTIRREVEGRQGAAGPYWSQSGHRRSLRHCMLTAMLSSRPTFPATIYQATGCTPVFHGLIAGSGPVHT